MRSHRQRAPAGPISVDDVLTAARHVVFDRLIAKLRVRYTLKQHTARSINFAIDTDEDSIIGWLQEVMDSHGPTEEPDYDLANPQDAYIAATILIGMKNHEDAHERKNAVTWAETVIAAFEQKGKANGQEGNIA